LQAWVYSNLTSLASSWRLQAESQAEASKTAFHFAPTHLQGTYGVYHSHSAGWS